MRTRGYTLLEILVATGLFVLLLGSLGGLFATFTRGQRSGIQQASLLGDVQGFLELLEREVRTGYGNTFGPEGDASPEFSLVNQEGQCVKWGRGTGATAHTLFRAAADPPCQPADLALASGAALTGRGLEVRNLTFAVRRAEVDQGIPPQLPLLTEEQGRVTVRLRLCPRGVDDARCLAVQTSLTSRQYGPI